MKKKKKKKKNSHPQTKFSGSYKTKEFIVGCFRKVTRWDESICLLRVKSLMWDLISPEAATGGVL